MALGRRPANADRFANIASGDVLQTAANALTFDEVLTGISLGVGVGIIIDQFDYYPLFATYRELVGNADSLLMAWTTSSDVTDLANYGDRRILHAIGIPALIVGAVVSLEHAVFPIDKQFFPPLIIASPRIYFALDMFGAAAAGQARSRCYYRFIELSPQEYLEIAETFQLTS